VVAVGWLTTCGFRCVSLVSTQITGLTRLQGVALTLPQLSAEFGVSETEVRYTTLALFLGLCIGASFWGTASDIIGRRLAFNFTLFLAGVFGLASGGGPNWIGTCALYACIGLGVGGNLPVDGALFLEFLPQTSGNLLTLLSVFWPVGNLIASLCRSYLYTAVDTVLTLRSGMGFYPQLLLSHFYPPWTVQHGR